MANGVLCKKCGYQEADHVGGMVAQFNEDEKAMAQAHPKLAKCNGYVPETEDGCEIEPTNMFYSAGYD